ncbi:MAG: ADP-glyceromanno-heptose 6-epimerase [Bacteroidales bacterium]|nr:ADP-glyceromanno-heptose 6-epimerase [Bacteroidales bacterium]
MIIITGAAGFIASNLITELNLNRFYDLVLVDDFSHEEKNKNFEGKKYSQKIHRDELKTFIDENHRHIQFVFHNGAKSATTGFPKSVYDSLNLEYSKMVWKACVEYGLPLVYASSAATYGFGELGYNDDHEIVEQLQPLNDYGISKNDFDKWALKQERQPYFWAGLKYFNVYGPNEYHKGRMASVVYHAFNQINATGTMKLFKSHHPDFKDGEQQRDFIYVKDLSSVMMFLMHHRKDSGLYNVGTGEARTFLDLVKNTFKAMGKDENIEFIPTPEDIRDKYQYFTEANMQKLRSIGYNKPFITLEQGVADYVKAYLIGHQYH